LRETPSLIRYEQPDNLSFIGCVPTEWPPVTIRRHCQVRVDDRTFRGARLSTFSLSLSLSLSFSSLSHPTHFFFSISTPFALPILSMSASTSSAPPSALGECVVCGKESATRCSKCAEGGVKWMSLCSVEHQKLVSPAVLEHVQAELICCFLLPNLVLVDVAASQAGLWSCVPMALSTSQGGARNV